MKITPIAATQIIDIPASLLDTEMGGSMLDARYGSAATQIDTLHEFAGRGCYQAWHKPNPDTRENDDYLANILDQNHTSVLEHGVVTFYIEDVSRALLLELERHRHASMSVESQRYVDPTRFHDEPVIPPLYREYASLEWIAEDLKFFYEMALGRYDDAYRAARDEGVPVKKAREAARAFLLESTPVNLTWTTNIRAARDVLGKRWHEAADAEMQEFAGLILDHLRNLAPASVQDIPETPYS